MAASNRMLIKMEMKNVIYTETPSKQKSGIELWLNKTSRWIAAHLGASKRHKPFLNPVLHVERN
jgi:hypothetical protein